MQREHTQTHTHTAGSRRLSTARVAALTARVAASAAAVTAVGSGSETRDSILYVDLRK